MAESKSVDISALLALDTTDSAAALALRRGVAELAGWRIKFARDGYWHLYGPGNYKRACVGEKMAVEGLPPYESSLDAALTLPLEEGYEFEIEYLWDGRSFARVRLPVSSNPSEADPPYEDANNPGYAVSRAWLRYRAAQSTPVATARDEEA